MWIICGAAVLHSSVVMFQELSSEVVVMLKLVKLWAVGTSAPVSLLDCYDQYLRVTALEKCQTAVWIHCFLIPYVLSLSLCYSILKNLVQIFRKVIHSAGHQENICIETRHPVCSPDWFCSELLFQQDNIVLCLLWWLLHFIKACPPPHPHCRIVTFVYFGVVLFDMLGRAFQTTKFLWKRAGHQQSPKNTKIQQPLRRLTSLYFILITFW